MFEDEIRMEEKSSSILPMLMVATLVLGVVAVAAYLINESMRTVSAEEALTATKAVVLAQRPETVHFHVGFVKPGKGDQPFDPHYRLLEKAGLVKLGKATYKGLDVKLTPAGAELLRACGAHEEKNQDGTVDYTVTLAERKLLKVTKVERVNSRKALVQYEWNWQPTQFGLVFDINGPAMSKLPVYDTAVLIDKYGATYYTEAKPQTSAFTLVWDEQRRTWRPGS
jgi:hypothetical protein